jgi:peptide chain release factor 3
MQSPIEREAARRRTFAIISHPDAGKTTLTEKLLYFGGAIRMAGEVRGRKAKKFATSDWMEIEKQRGISVTSSVMQFDYTGHQINILDTPGHQDFSDDTYRTLIAADSAVMVLDAAKGVEAQTIKLFKVCRLRRIPIFAFINKMDRYGKAPLALVEEIEQVLGLRCCPMNWPIGMGDEFAGIYNRERGQIERYSAAGDEIAATPADGETLERELSALLGERDGRALREEIELLDVAGDAFDRDKILQGDLIPLYFGSAINTFGVRTFLESYIELSPPPGPRESDQGLIPVGSEFSGFIFKIQANMNPAHRDRVAFLRICSGRFERGMTVNQPRSGKKIRLAAPQQFLAQERNLVEEAFPGDIIGLHDPGLFQIGETLTAEGSFAFPRLPQFSPEYFSRVYNVNTGKYKQFQKGIAQLAEEGTVQVFRSVTRTEDLILGAVGQLQFDVFSYRLREEYDAEIRLEPMPYQLARWIHTDLPVAEDHLSSLSSLLVKDQYDRYAVLCESDYTLRWLSEQNPEVEFMENSWL